MDYQKISKYKNYFVLILVIPFTQFCYQIFSQNYPEIDNQVLLYLEDKQVWFFNLFFKAIYQIGGAYITGGIVLLALIILIVKRFWQEAKTLAFSTLGILILVDKVLKPLFDRDRPPHPRLVKDLSKDSFPSGHAAGNLVLYFYLSLVLANVYPKFTKYIYGLATIIIFLMGFGSIYTKAHWLTDVLAGYVFGYLWLSASLLILKLSSRGKTKVLQVDEAQESEQ